MYYKTLILFLYRKIYTRIDIKIKVSEFLMVSLLLICNYNFETGLLFEIPLAFKRFLISAFICKGDENPFLIHVGNGKW